MGNNDSHCLRLLNLYHMNDKKLIAITGGIGSGKTVVSKMLIAMGYEVYDCDCRAKMLMDNDESIKARLVSEVHPECVICGVIDRKILAAKVFSDADALASLNRIVHSAVRADLSDWSAESDARVKFVETAILYQSDLDFMVDEVWEVVAPVDLRIERVQARNNATRDEVMSRISVQEAYDPGRMHPCRRVLVNDGAEPLLPQIEHYLNLLSK